jgi:predicted nucleotidyltransferase
MNLGNLLKEKRAAILDIAKRHGARNVRVFGSAARGNYDEQSDLDFLVDLERLLGCKVGVVSEKGIKARMRERVLKEARPL